MKKINPFIKFFTMTGFLSILMLGLSGCSEPQIPTGYALIYGIADYSSWSGFYPGYTLGSLDLTDDDALAMAEMLEDKGWDVRLRLDDGSQADTAIASREQFEEDIVYLSTIMNQEDRFLFYYSGHGASISGQGDDIEPDSGVAGDEWIFLYADAPDWSQDEWLDHTFNDDSLGAELSRLPNRIKMVILDSCNSGGFIGTSPTVDTIPWNYTPTKDSDYEEGTAGAAFSAWLNFPETTSADILSSEAIVMTAAGENEESWESGDHGIFTGLLLETPANGDKNGDGWITVTEAYVYCLDGLQASWNAAELEDYEQLQIIYGDDPYNHGYVDNYSYLPHITGSPLDFILYEAD
ncbi:MAG: caspase family protein [Spirochaetales bacterium]|nr:caspase family protein [Spirochaetales bacterium]